MSKVILKMQNITKYIFDAYGKPIHGTDVKILKDVNFDVHEAEVHILVGENGAGKSTLMKILGGIIPYDEGSMELFGQKVSFTNPRHSQEMGVGFIHQELNLCQNLNVAENLFLGRELSGRVFSNKKEMYKRSREMLMSLGFDIDPRTKVKNLSTAQQQIVEIVKVISYDSKLVIMDEPTASLTQAEIDHLFEIIRNMVKQGISVIYISHRFEELKEIGDRLTVLRDGSCVGTIDMKDFDHDKVVNMMVGRTLTKMYTCTHTPKENEILRVEDLRIGQGTEPVNIHVNAGEIVGIGGLVGAGRTELAKSIFGARKYFGGRITYLGEEIHGQTPRRMIEKGLMYLSEDRKIEGLVLPMDLVCNISLASLPRIFKNTYIKKDVEEKMAREMIGEMDVVCNSSRQLASTLSGGNQQKVALAKWLVTNPKLLILDEPTRGIDVNAKAEIYEIMDRLAGSGVGILMISSELPELIGMSDRIYIMKQGTISGELTDHKEFRQETILAYTI